MDFLVVRLIFENSEIFTVRDEVLETCEQIGVDLKPNLIQINAFDYMFHFNNIDEATREKLRRYLLQMYIQSKIQKMSFSII